LFASFKVQSFRGFVRYENLATVWDKTKVFYQTARHAQPFGALRFGIAWRFMDSNLVDENKKPNPAPGAGGSVGFSMERVQILDSRFGLSVTGPANGAMRDSTITGSTENGVIAIGGADVAAVSLAG
jgi:hypothetical protein